MTAVCSQDDERPRLLGIPGWLAACLLFGITLALAPVSGSLARPVFVLGCVAAGWWAWRQSPGSHLQAVLILFTFAPFARRMVDFYAGFDDAGLMLVGPLLAMLVPVHRLIAYIDGRSNMLANGVAPMTVALCCVAYAALLSLFQAAWMDATAGAIKWLAPILYAAVLVETGDRRKLMDAATNAFVVILPIVGLYGSYQYVDPPGWDRYWMQFATAITAGLPLPYEIRVYSTLNGPASFATFTAAGILLVSFLRPFWLSVIVAAPAALALMVSQYRTAWISLAVGLLFCLLFSRTRARSGLLFACLALGGMVALTIPTFSDALIERLESFSEGSQDGSFQKRLEQFAPLWEQPASSLVGTGFTTADAGAAGAVQVDGMLITCWYMMGIVVGVICLSSFAWAAGRMIVNAFASGQADAIVLGGLGCGALLQIPLASLASGELGFLFWSFAAIACLPDPLDDPSLEDDEEW